MEYDLIDKENYDNYINEVVNISKTSTEKMSILYNYQFNEDVYNDNNSITEKDYIGYLDRLYVYWVGVGDKEIYEILKGLWILGANAGHKRVKSMVFHMIDVIEKRG